MSPDPPVQEHHPGSFTFCYTGCATVVQCETASGPAKDPHFRTKEAAAAWWASQMLEAHEHVPVFAERASECPPGGN